MKLTKREQDILRETRERITRWGHHADIPATPYELAALVLKLEHIADEAGREAAELAASHEHVEKLREELTLARRQLGAAKTRETALRKQLAAVQQQEAGE